MIKEYDGNVDFVFMFVNPFDKVWTKEYFKHFNRNPLDDPRQVKSPKLLRYFLRSVAKNMPWISKMHMVVACPTQVPSWINRDTINVVFHKDIIPERWLPTFNLTSISRFVNSIPDLA